MLSSCRFDYQLIKLHFGYISAFLRLHIYPCFSASTGDKKDKKKDGQNDEQKKGGDKKETRLQGEPEEAEEAMEGMSLEDQMMFHFVSKEMMPFTLAYCYGKDKVKLFDDKKESRLQVTKYFIRSNKTFCLHLLTYLTLRFLIFILSLY